MGVGEGQTNKAEGYVYTYVCEPKMLKYTHLNVKTFEQLTALLKSHIALKSLFSNFDRKNAYREMRTEKALGSERE